MSQQLTTLSRESIQFLCELIRNVSTLPNSVIDNINLANNTTFDSIHITDLINNTLVKANDRAEELCNALTKLTCKKTTVQPTLDNSELNIIYLFSSDGNVPYEQYLKISDTELIDMGSTSISLNDYLTVTDAVSTYAKKVDLDTLATEVTNIKSDFTTHKNDADIHTSADEKASYVKKTDITTTIDGTSTDDEVPSALTVFNAISKLLECKENTKDLDIDIYEEPFTAHVNSNSGVLGTFPNGVIWGTIIQLPAKNYRCQMFLAINKMYYRTMNNKVWGNWIEVCSTKVKDIPVTNISMSSTYTNNPNCKYQVVNGICYVDFMSGTYKLTSNVNGVILATGLPIPRTGQVCTTYVPWSCADASKQVIIFVNGRGELILHASVNANATPMFCTFSYPVKES